jgi:hypothetical protein
MKQFFFSLLFVSAALSSNAQVTVKIPSLSPTTKISQDFSLSSIEIAYSRPSMRGRKVFGNVSTDMVPWGKVWRTGANAPTKIKIGEELEIAGHKVKAGEYSLYTIPDRDKWEVVINTGTGAWTAEGFPREFDVARFTAKVLPVEGDVQTFTLQITDMTYNTCKLELSWERTKIAIPIVAMNKEAVATNIDKALNTPPTLPYFQVANYYYESNIKTEMASEYVNKAIEQDPKAFYVWYLKARVEKRLGHKEEAKVAAKKSMELAKGTPNEAEYIRNNQKIIDEVNKTLHYKQSAD